MGNGLLSKEEILVLAKDFGFDVSFDSPEPGVFDTVTGELRDISSHLQFVCGEFQILEDDKGINVNAISVKAKQVKVRRFEDLFEDYHKYPCLDIA
ncbi:hypothetical protein [Lysinibacillus sp. FSL W8-0992]|uniref:hypothetical protein n=1 Tax=Lysinibacillus sp. FSL W8-0992 TaxID=2954643 RepID=UPI0030FCE12C